MSEPTQKNFIDLCFQLMFHSSVYFHIPKVITRAHWLNTIILYILCLLLIHSDSTSVGGWSVLIIATQGPRLTDFILKFATINPVENILIETW